MPKSPLISIIVPTFNRAHLIGETLDSVLEQTYQNWECIVVDDGSTDGTTELMNAYCVKDSRFQYHKRPNSYLSGGNGARNYGFEISKGDYIQWFDSDDLMEPEAMALKVKALLEFNVDFVISKSKYINIKKEFYHYNYTTEDISFNSFAFGNVSWVTDDIIYKRDIVSGLNYNESLKAGQEYNFCCKVLLVSNKCYFLDKFLTLRRSTENSIGTNRRKEKTTYLQSRFEVYWINYKEIVEKTKNIQFEKHTLLVCISTYFRSGKKIKLPKGFNSAVRQTFGSKTIYFYAALTTYYLFGKYNFFYLKLK